MTETTRGVAARMRAELKRAGYTSRDVSVRVEYFSMGWSIDATIRSPSVDPARVKAILESGERIDHCKITGEIVSGSKRYVELHYSPEVRAAWSELHADDVRAAHLRLDGLGRDHLVPINDEGWQLGYSGGGWREAVAPDCRRAMAEPTDLGIAETAFQMEVRRRTGKWA